MVIGSTAIAHWFPDFPRKPKDCDVIKESNLVPVNCEKVEYLSNPILLEYYSDCYFLNATGLLTLKMSHLFWDINWDKHMFDVQFLIKKEIGWDRKLFPLLYEYWNTIHGKNKRSDLEMSAEQFFDNAVKSEYDHDWLHALLNPYPTFNKVLKDGEEVDVCEHKFYNLTHEEKCDLVIEEVMIMAYERYKHLDFRIAYSKMLRKFIMNHAPMWEAIFIIENYVELHKPKFDYFKTIDDGITAFKQNS